MICPSTMAINPKGRKAWRGVIRDDGRVIWGCEHEHSFARSLYGLPGTVALVCAKQAFARQVHLGRAGEAKEGFLAMALVTVEHSYYGCESGCCGHVILDEAGEQLGWSFSHPNFWDAEVKAYLRDEERAAAERAYIAEILAEAKVEADVDYENSNISDD